MILAGCGGAGRWVGCGRRLGGRISPFPGACLPGGRTSACHRPCRREPYGLCHIRAPVAHSRTLIPRLAFMDTPLARRALFRLHRRFLHWAALDRSINGTDHVCGALLAFGTSRHFSPPGTQIQECPKLETKNASFDVREPAEQIRSWPNVSTVNQPRERNSENNSVPNAIPTLGPASLSAASNLTLIRFAASSSIQLPHCFAPSIAGTSGQSETASKPRQWGAIQSDAE